MVYGKNSSLLNCLKFRSTKYIHFQGLPAKEQEKGRN